MKIWKKYDGQSERYYDGLLAVVVLTGLIGFIINQPLLFVPTGLLLSLLLASKLFDRFSGSNLHLHDYKRSIRLFPGDATHLSIRMNNLSRIPVLNGMLTFQIDKSVRSSGGMERGDNDELSYRLPLSLISHGESEVHLPIQAESRGVAKIKGITFRYPHLLRFSPIKIEYNTTYNIEFIVYPKPKKIHGIDEVFHMSMGDHPASLSPFEDILTPLGTRDYVPSDPFHRIHWKASAKTNTLKTKVYERQIDISWTILVNVTEHTRLGNEHLSPEMEDLLSYACDLCYYATEHGYPYEMVVNMRRPHQKPYFYQSEGEGNQHLRDSLELLARVEKKQIPLPMNEMMYRLSHQFYKQKTVIILGEVPDQSLPYVKQWEAKGIRVIRLYVEGTFATLAPIRLKEGQL
ncbi:DUF58 domain-containing protein [Halobacillus litoralis]|uniref:DUF58 domain-containing protein n=1 Tax=Halobacillus litoralis TaxID=45668 RepID=UPI0024925021|nr:DUF58 domain-containing protein [Halobacillus litoralis]